jgi:hypothetical protein
MSTIMSDVIEGTMPPSVANAAVNAGGKLLKVVEMQNRYGTQQGDGAGKVLALSDFGEAVATGQDEAIAALQEQIAAAQHQLRLLKSGAA